MSIPTTDKASIHHQRIVDNAPAVYPRWTRQQNRIGGLRGSATRRFNARHIHYQIVHLSRMGVPVATVARLVGRAVSTCYAVLSGRIRRCLTLAESRLLGPWKPGKFKPVGRDSTELTPVFSNVVRPAQKTRKRRPSRRNWCHLDCDKGHKHWYSPWVWATIKGQQQEYWDKATAPLPDTVPCKCGFDRPSRPQPCPVCGRTLNDSAKHHPERLDIID